MAYRYGKDKITLRLYHVYVKASTIDVWGNPTVYRATSWNDLDNELSSWQQIGVIEAYPMLMSEPGKERITSAHRYILDSENVSFSLKDMQVSKANYEYLRTLHGERINILFKPAGLQSIDGEFEFPAMFGVELRAELNYDAEGHLFVNLTGNQETRNADAVFVIERFNTFIIPAGTPSTFTATIIKSGNAAEFGYDGNFDKDNTPSIDVSGEANPPALIRFTVDNPVEVTSIEMGNMQLDGLDLIVFKDFVNLTSLDLQGGIGTENELYYTASALRELTALGNLNLYKSGLSAAQVDQILLDLADNVDKKAVATVDLSGNTAPTAAGTAAALILSTATWSVTVD